MEDISVNENYKFSSVPSGMAYAAYRFEHIAELGVFKKTAGITDDVLKDKVIGALKKDIPKLKEALDFNTVKKIFPADELIDETNYAERLIKNFEKVENFNKVFKVVE